MAKVEEDETESNLKIINDQGGPRMRIPPQRFPGLSKVLGDWMSRIPVVGSVGRFLASHDYRADYEMDSERHQVIIYIAEPGYHTTKLLKELKKAGK